MCHDGAWLFHHVLALQGIIPTQRGGCTIALLFFDCIAVMHIRPLHVRLKMRQVSIHMMSWITDYLIDSTVWPPAEHCDWNAAEQKGYLLRTTLCHLLHFHTLHCRFLFFSSFFSRGFFALGCVSRAKRTDSICTWKLDPVGESLLLLTGCTHLVCLVGRSTTLRFSVTALDTVSEA